MDVIKIWVIKSRHSGRIVDSAATLETASNRCRSFNEVYQTDEYKVEEWSNE